MRVSVLENRDRYFLAGICIVGNLEAVAPLRVFRPGCRAVTCELMVYLPAAVNELALEISELQEHRYLL